MPGRRRSLAVATLLSVVTAVQATSRGADDLARPATVPVGPGSFVFTDRPADPAKPLTVWTWAPDDLGPATPVVFVMHGALRNGRTYRDHWIGHAKAKHVLLVVPEFSREAYPGVTYNDGNLSDRAGRPVDPSRWAFTVIERLFDEVKRVTGDRSAAYFLYGHSAGGQFVQRFVLLMPHARYARAVAANPGWHTLPEQDQPFPAGLKGTATSDEVLRTVLGRPVTLLLGERDTDPVDPDLNRSPPAMAEGPFRFARGQFFFARLQAAAARLNVPLQWQLKAVPTAGHSDVQMSAAAADLLFPATSSR